MSLFNRDLYRQFGIGFGLGAIAVVLTSGKAVLDTVPQFLAALF